MDGHRSVTLWIGIAVGLVLLWLATRSVDFEAMGTALSRARLWWAFPFLLILTGFYVLKAVRWGILMRPIAKVPHRLLLRAVMIGYASNAVLPAQLGDLVRAVVTSREMGLRLAPILTTLVVERALDLLIVVGLLAAVVVMRPDVPAPIALAGLTVAIVCAASLFLLFAYGRHTTRWLSGLQRTTSWLPATIQLRIMGQARAGADGARALATPGPFILVVAMSVAKWLLMAACNLISLVALNIDAPPAAAVLVLACTVLALLLPSAPGYVGAIQIAYVLALTPFGVSASDAVAASLFFHVFAYGFTVLAGWYYFHASGYHLADLRADINREP